MSTMFSVPIPTGSRGETINAIVHHLRNPTGMVHIVSLNPEIMVIAQRNAQFLQVLRTAKMRIIDGMGVWIAAKMFGYPVADRLTGVDCMQEVVGKAVELRLRVMFVGGDDKVAETIAEHYRLQYGYQGMYGVRGISDLHSHNTDQEDADLICTLKDVRPHILFVSFGSPAQELWIEKHRNDLNGMVCMGVGGGFDFVAGRVKRAPSWMRRWGMEWAFRLWRQPWRWRRQLRLVVFVWLVISRLFLRHESVR